jgi:hypothetical protein
MEPVAVERFEVDWGHFGALTYSGDSRKLSTSSLLIPSASHSSQTVSITVSTAVSVRVHLFLLIYLAGRKTYL